MLNQKEVFTLIAVSSCRDPMEAGGSAALNIICIQAARNVEREKTVLSRLPPSNAAPLLLRNGHINISQEDQ